MKVLEKLLLSTLGPEMDKLNVGLSFEPGRRKAVRDQGDLLSDTEPTGKALPQLRRDNVSTKHNDPEVETPNT